MEQACKGFFRLGEQSSEEVSSFSSQRERCAGRSLLHQKDGIHGDVDGSQPEVWSARGGLARADDVTGMRRVSESQKQLMDLLFTLLSQA